MDPRDTVGMNIVLNAAKGEIVQVSTDTKITFMNF